MTQSNLLHTKEVPPENMDARRTFWGAIALSGILTLISIYFMTVLLRQPQTAVITIANAVFLSIIVVAVISVILAVRNRQVLGLQLLLLAANVIGIMAAGLFVGRTLPASLSILLISVITIRWGMPAHLRRRYAVIGGIAFVLMWVIDAIHPAWRIQLPAATVGPVAAVVFAVVFVVFALSRFRDYSLRSKLLSSILLTTGLSVLIFGYFAYTRTQQSQTLLTDQLYTTVSQQSQQQLNNTAQAEASAADQTLSAVAADVKNLAASQTLFYSQQSLLGQGAYWDAHTKVTKMSGGQYGNSPNDPSSIFIPSTVTLTESMISDLNTTAYLDFSAPGVMRANPDVVAVYFNSATGFSTYYPNISLAANVPPDFDVLSQSFYTVAIPANDPQHNTVWTQPYQDPAGTGLIVTCSVPVYDQNNQFRGVMSADLQLSRLSAQIAAVKLGQTGFAFLVDSSGHMIAMPDAGYKFFNLQPETVPVNETPKETILGQGPADLQAITRQMTGGQQGFATLSYQNEQYYVAYVSMPSVGYSIGMVVPKAELDAAFFKARDQITSETQSTLNLALIVLLAILISAAGVGSFLSQYISRPLVDLTKSAERISAGDLDVQAKVVSKDETGILARTFNKMTSQLREIISSLENRVADRTRNLELAAEVGRSVAQVRALDVMLKDAAELIRSQFDLYYVQVYLVNPSQTELVLESGTGTVGEELLNLQHRLSLNAASINGRAAIEKKSVVIPDTNASTSFHPNPLLPDTRGEMAVPLLFGEKVLGVLDMQTRYPGNLDENLLPAFEALAGQLAVAIQNANLLAEAEQARAEVEKQARHLVRAGWDEYLDAIHKPEQTGFLFDRNQVVPLDEVESSPLPGEENAVSVALAISGEPIGQLVVEMDKDRQSKQATELVNTVARQAAQQIEALRLLDSAERYRREAEDAARRLTRESWQGYVEARSRDNLGFLYDLNEVKPYSSQMEMKPEGSVVTLPLKVRDESIGKLTVLGVDEADGESREFAGAVAERLGSHIESLRQQDETQAALAQSSKLFEASRRLTEATDLQELVKGAVESLDISDIDRAILGSLSYTSDGEMEEMTIIANWSKGSDLSATPLGTSYPKEALNTVSLFTSSEPLFFNDMLNDGRVDEATKALAIRVKYRSVAALPLFTGSRRDAVLLLEGQNPHNFTKEEIRLFTSLGPQLATVLENRRQYERTQKQAEREAMLNTISQKIQSATSVEAVLQIAARELGHALGAPRTIAQLSMKDKN